MEGELCNIIKTILLKNISIKTIIILSPVVQRTVAVEGGQRGPPSPRQGALQNWHASTPPIPRWGTRDILILFRSGK